MLERKCSKSDTGIFPGPIALPSNRIVSKGLSLFIVPPFSMVSGSKLSGWVDPACKPLSGNSLREPTVHARELYQIYPPGTTWPKDSMGLNQ